MNATDLFAYHSGGKQLVVIDHEAREGVAYPLVALTAAGWRVKHEDFARSLPPFETGPQLFAPGGSGSIRAAAAQERGRRDFESKLRAGR
jgi:hypothetical protein